MVTDMGFRHLYLFCFRGFITRYEYSLRLVLPSCDPLDIATQSRSAAVAIFNTFFLSHWESAETD